MLTARLNFALWKTIPRSHIPLNYCYSDEDCVIPMQAYSAMTSMSKRTRGDKPITTVSVGGDLALAYPWDDVKGGVPVHRKCWFEGMHADAASWICDYPSCNVFSDDVNGTAGGKIVRKTSHHGRWVLGGLISMLV